MSAPQSSLVILPLLREGVAADIVGFGQLSGPSGTYNEGCTSL
jgi:hypothetical protein